MVLLTAVFFYAVWWMLTVAFLMIKIILPDPSCESLTGLWINSGLMVAVGIFLVVRMFSYLKDSTRDVVEAYNGLGENEKGMFWKIVLATSNAIFSMMKKRKGFVGDFCREL